MKALATDELGVDAKKELGLVVGTAAAEDGHAPGRRLEIAVAALSIRFVKGFLREVIKTITRRADRPTDLHKCWRPNQLDLDLGTCTVQRLSGEL